MRIVFLGSPEEVLPILEACRELPPAQHQLVAIVSQPAKPAGRRRLMTQPAVAQRGFELNLATMQPAKASDPGFLRDLEALKPDVMITAAYGQILSDELLAIPTRATINVHPSLLPDLRGATPVQTALLRGDPTTGVSILFTVKALDAGALILKEQTAIDPDENAWQLMTRLFRLGAKLLPLALERLADPAFVGDAQDENQVTLCRKIQKVDGLVQWPESSKDIYNRFRAFQPWPGLYTFFRQKRVVLSQLRRVELPEDTGHPPGTFWYERAVKELRVCTGQGILAITRLKPEGGKEQDASMFWNGARLVDIGVFDV